MTKKGAYRRSWRDRGLCHGEEGAHGAGPSKEGNVLVVCFVIVKLLIALSHNDLNYSSVA